MSVVAPPGSTKMPEANTKAQDVLNYWDAHTMGTQFLRGENVEPGTREYFERLHPIIYRYEYVPPIFDAESKKLQDKKLLEVGCGMGFDVIEWAKRGVDVSAVDLTPNAIKIAEHHVELMGQKAELQVGSALDLPYPDNTFDAVWSRGVLHVTSDTPKAISEVYRVLKPGGRMIVVNLYNKYSWFVFFTKFGRENFEFKEEDAPVIDLYTVGEIKQLFSTFDQLEVCKEHYYPYKTRRPGLKAKLFNNIFCPVYRLLPRFLVRPFGFKFVIKGYKPNKG
jgi:ubiquinone/menaquinone biosynthesis C-methylase UbiE